MAESGAAMLFAIHSIDPSSWFSPAPQARCCVKIGDGEASIVVSVFIVPLSNKTERERGKRRKRVYRHVERDLM